MPTQEKSKLIESGIPSEVIKVIGFNYIPLHSPIIYNAALEYLEKTYKENGLEWIKKNVEQVRFQLEMENAF